MNMLSLMHREYRVSVKFNESTDFWELEFYNPPLGDIEHANKMSKREVEFLRDNAKRLYEALDLTLMDK